MTVLHALGLVLATLGGADTSDTEPARVVENLRRALLRVGPFEAVYEVARPARDERMTIRIRADLPWSCSLVSGSGADEVRAYADVRGRRMVVLGREGGRLTLVKTSAEPMVAGAEAVRRAILDAGLAKADWLPALGDAADTATADALHLFTVLTLGPARGDRGRPFIRSGTGLAVGPEVRPGTWLAGLASPRVTRKPAGDGYRFTNAEGMVLVVSRRTGLPTSASVQPDGGDKIALTLKRFDRLPRFEPPAWAVRPAEDVRVETRPMPAPQRRAATYRAWAFYIGRCVVRLAGEADWRTRLKARREAIVAGLSGQAEALWGDRRAGLPRAFLVVERGAHTEAGRRFHYLKESDPAKARTIARQYAAEALDRRGDLLDETLEKAMEQFARDLPRAATAAGDPTRASVLAEVVGLLRAAARRSYLTVVADRIADRLVNERPARQGRVPGKGDWLRAVARCLSPFPARRPQRVALVPTRPEGSQRLRPPGDRRPSPASRPRPAPRHL